MNGAISNFILENETNKNKQNKKLKIPATVVVIFGCMLTHN